MKWIIEHTAKAAPFALERRLDWTRKGRQLILDCLWRYHLSPRVPTTTYKLTLLSCWRQLVRYQQGHSGLSGRPSIQRRHPTRPLGTGLLPGWPQCRRSGGFRTWKNWYRELWYRGFWCTSLALVVYYWNYFLDNKWLCEGSGLSGSDCSLTSVFTVVHPCTMAARWQCLMDEILWWSSRPWWLIDDDE